MYIEIGKLFEIDGLSIYQIQNQNQADVIYKEQEMDRYGYEGDRYADINRGGYKADYEGYGDEIEYNIQSDNQLNFVCQR